MPQIVAFGTFERPRTDLLLNYNHFDAESCQLHLISRTAVMRNPDPLSFHTSPRTPRLLERLSPLSPRIEKTLSFSMHAFLWLLQKKHMTQTSGKTPYLPASLGHGRIVMKVQDCSTCICQARLAIRKIGLTILSANLDATCHLLITLLEHLYQRFPVRCYQAFGVLIPPMVQSLSKPMR